MAGKGDDLIKEAVMGRVRKSSRPAFVSRIDEIVVFHGRDLKHIASIARIQLKRQRQLLDGASGLRSHCGRRGAAGHGANEGGGLSAQR